MLSSPSICEVASVIVTIMQVFRISCCSFLLHKYEVPFRHIHGQSRSTLKVKECLEARSQRRGTRQRAKGFITLCAIQKTPISVSPEPEGSQGLF